MHIETLDFPHQGHSESSGASLVQFGILGPLEVTSDGTAIDVNGPKQRTLLVLLILHANTVVSTDKIIEALWGEHANGNALGTLRVHIANLRRTLEPGDEPPLILTRPSGYLLEVDGDAVDAHRFARLVAEGGRALPADAGQASRLFERSLDLWRGAALEDVAYESFAQAEIRRLDELRSQAIEGLVEARLRLGRHAEMVPELEALVAAHPLRERLWGQLMVALHRSGRQADALATYRRVADVLARHGLAPGLGLERLEERILLNDPALMSSTPAAEPHRRLPAERTSLIGREAELAKLDSLLASTRLLTLTGTGGVGKTRLAQRLAWSTVESGTDVWWVDLGGVTDSQLIPDQIAAAGGITPGANVDTKNLLTRLLSTRDLLIVLDNCEHLIEGVARAVDRFLGDVRRVRFIATSREPLQVDGERVWRVPSLPVPDAGDPTDELDRCPSVRLFLDRARARGATIDNQALSSIAEICRRLDGIPLALELAAARATTLTPRDISERLADRFSLLERGGRTALARHRTLEGAIDWSFRLLDDAERRLLTRLAVFVGAFDLASALEVCAFDPLAAGDVEAGLERLVEKSMVECSGGDPGRRFRLIESIRSFAWDRLVDDPDRLLTLHRDWALRLATTGGRELLSDEHTWFPRLESAYEDFRAAFNESMRKGEIDSALRLVGSLGGYLLWRRTREALGWLETGIEAAEAQPSAVRDSTRALALLAIGPVLCYHDRIEEGRRRLAEAAELYTELDHVSGLMWTRYQQSHFTVAGDPDECLQMAEAAVDLARRASDPVGLAYALTRLAEVRLFAVAGLPQPSPAELEAVISICREAGSYCEQLPNAYAEAMLKIAWGKAIALQGNEEGLLLVEDGVRDRTRYGRGIPCATEFVSAGHLALRFGHGVRAATWIRRGLEAFQDLGLMEATRPALVGAAAVLRRPQPHAAARLIGAASRLRRPSHYGILIVDDDDRIETDLRSELGDAAFVDAYEAGTRLSFQDAMDLAITAIGEG